MNFWIAYRGLICLTLIMCPAHIVDMLITWMTMMILLSVKNVMRCFTERETEQMAKIYVASSWRNERQPILVNILRTSGHEVYDFRNPTVEDKGFHWSEIDGAWQSWTTEEYRIALSHPLAESGFEHDADAMEWADVFVGVQPFGRSASMEMGWAAGKGKTTMLLLDNGEPELMVKMFDHICCDLSELMSALDNL